MNILQWRDTNDLSRGFIVDLETCTVPDLFTIYSESASHIEAFTEAFQLMGLNDEIARQQAIDHYEKIRLELDRFISRFQAMPVSYAPPANTVTH